MGLSVYQAWEAWRMPDPAPIIMMRRGQTHQTDITLPYAQRVLGSHAGKSNTSLDSHSRPSRSSVSATVLRFSAVRPSCQWKDSAEVGSPWLEVPLMLPAGVPEEIPTSPCSCLLDALPDLRACLDFDLTGIAGGSRAKIPLKCSSSASRYRAT